MSKFVAVTCACGASFQRERKRGRPQVWCPECLVISFSKRVRSETQPDADAPDSPERIVNEHDPLDHVRAEIEAGMVEINAEHKVRFDALVATGMSPWDAGEVAGQETFVRTSALYAPHRPNKKPIGGVALDD